MLTVRNASGQPEQPDSRRTSPESDSTLSISGTCGTMGGTNPPTANGMTDAGVYVAALHERSSDVAGDPPWR